MGEERPYEFILLTETREELIEKCIKLYRENERLRKENDLLREKVNQKHKPKSKQSEPEKQIRGKSKPPHQWGRKPGHAGATRPTPDHIDREVEQTLLCCPDCRHHLSEPQEVIKHIQEDIIPSRVIVTRYERYRYWCRHCDKMVEAPYAPDEVPGGHIGPLALITMATLKYHHGLPGNKIKELIRDLSGLSISEGAISQALGRLAFWLKIEADKILEAIRQSPYVHMDETGWKVNGKNHWLWAAVNERLASYRIDRSRGSKVAKEILGEVFHGTLVTDFYSAYNKLSSKQQKCLVHLLREMRQLRARDAPEDYLIPHRKLKRLIADALRLNERREKIDPLVYLRRRMRLDERLIDFACAVYSNKNWQRLSKRILKHHKAILAFLDTPGLPSNNNQAERAIRPHVIIRNRSYQSRTQKGADAHATLTSLLHTLQLQGRNPLEELQKAYLWHRQGNKEPILFAQA